MFSFKVIIAPRRYHVCKETSWSNSKLNDEVKVELETDAKSLSTDPYACAIKSRHSYFVGSKTVGHKKQGIPTSSVRKQWDTFHEKSLAMFIFY